MSRAYAICPHVERIVLQVNFKCIDQWVDPKHHITVEGMETGGGLGGSGRKYLQTSIDVTKEDVEEYRGKEFEERKTLGKDEYWCECHAWNNAPRLGVGGAKSRRSVVYVASMSLDTVLTSWFKVIDTELSSIRNYVH